MTAAVGLTGGIGSGKSTAAAMFAELGVPVLDLDEVGRSLCEEAEVLDALQRTFGGDIVQHGALDRRALARRVFADEAELARLNAILHPKIWQRAERWLERLDAPYAIIEASALIESGGRDRVDALVVILADEGVRRLRVRKRGHPLAELLDAILARQCSDEERRAAADYLLFNEGSLSSLRKQVERLHRELQQRFAA